MLIVTVQQPKNYPLKRYLNMINLDFYLDLH